MDDFTLTRRHTRELSTNLSFPDPFVRLEVKPRSLGAFRVFMQLDFALESLVGSGVLNRDDLDEMIKRYLTDEYMWRFALMQLISLVHAVLSFMAFKNDGDSRKTLSSVS